jgi:hypothetical protein
VSQRTFFSPDDADALLFETVVDGILNLRSERLADPNVENVYM